LNSETENVNKKIQEAWKHVKPYMDNESTNGELREMCKICEAWYGEEHNYENCINKPCFKFWLAYQYLLWLASWE